VLPFLMFVILVLLIAFLVMVLRNISQTKGSERLVACLPLVVLSLATANIVLNFNEHNLWPIEIGIWLAISFVIHVVVVFVPALVLGYKKHK
jgi:hypothetical protein